MRFLNLLALLVLPMSVTAMELTVQQTGFVAATLARDADGDGRLNEAEAGLGFATMDSNRDGFVDAQEIQLFALMFLRPFAWINPLPTSLSLPPGVEHHTFLSPSMQRAVGYVVYLPPLYQEQPQRRYPTVFYLHGGRPGNETRSIALTRVIHDAMLSGAVPPAIYVFANGGRVSHYNTPDLDSMGEDLLIKELIPHIDSTYRTIANPQARALEGFSQGGRGTTRIAFKYPKLFASAAAGAPGYGVERSIYENGGVEEDRRGNAGRSYDFGKGNDAYSLASRFSAKKNAGLSLAVWIGSEDFNFADTLEYLGYLYALDIQPLRLIRSGVGHNPLHMYEDMGAELMCFHANNFAQNGHSTGCESP